MKMRDILLSCQIEGGEFFHVGPTKKTFLLPIYPLKQKVKTWYF